MIVRKCFDDWFPPVIRRRHVHHIMIILKEFIGVATPVVLIITQRVSQIQRMWVVL